MEAYQIKSVANAEMLMPLLIEALQNGQSVRFAPTGTSMRPMLRQGMDSVVLSPVTGKLKRFDLPLYRRDDGKYVLHRIVKAGEEYTCLGDNQFVMETGVRQDQMIAVVTAFYRREKKYPVTHPGYRLYCRIWYHSRSLRRLFRRSVNWMHRHLT